ncbi:isocitrate/isopropylmalate dehydrogenase family protein [Sporosalibacterium faouarense]|uniref:isocitrate/isopropylmalate dehydrogenase family protein n=1 Tax=Sporosalibacterium faouarense TaxID=516123 RepID=UPI00192B11A8|nr:isocitrate/isopropylmalate dehydrogenase family protein [Sporosalibacterium faouarense]
MERIITLIPGDGIGKGIIDATTKIIEATGAKITWDVQEAGLLANEKYGNPLPEETLKSIEKNKIALKGPLTTPVGVGFRSINVALRQHFKLFANVRPIKSFDGIDSLHNGVDLVIVRENTEDLYKGIEYMVTKDVAESIKIITKEASLKICNFAFDLARQEKRNKVTLVHKANIMKFSDGLFLKSGAEVSSNYKDIEFEDVIVDAMAMKMVMNPKDYSVIVAPNLYGDILSDLGAGLIGGLGIAPSGNIGENCAIFEPVHGSAPDIAGKNIANPTSAILSGVMLLKYIKEFEAASKIEKALEEVLKDKEKCTIDIGGKLSTTEFTNAVIGKIKDL